MKTLARVLSATSVGFVSALLIGCGTGAPDITGRVISGPSSIVMAADPKDPRMSQDGIASTNIVVRKYAGEGSTGPIIASGVSTEKGEFRMPLTDIDAQKFEMVLTATTPDKRISRGRFFMQAGRPILVVVRDTQ
jgi:hypothetical protein